MARKIGLDLGSKSLGIALSDPLNFTAQGKENFRFEERDWDAAINKLKEYFDEYDIDVIVLGYVTYISGDKSETTYMIEEFREVLEKNFNVPIIYIDEKNTTNKAHEIMIGANLSRKKRKKNKDKLAAQLILEDYLMRI
ncbi:Holliday junction resolvase RuvX [Mycoplasma marinum]|uniref:Putative pre-16S rRNA nuclease n=1 Tax=Mycoplasma marinum TaxID=1937190 RepID=A0A4R0XTA7_9MOLU|nr:Holliday junction resolvase RuvX [Mycoplasma marinum]TCG11713.1 Holliday junction resolvase RuvX [Mycoplasma marinum]